MPVFLQIVAINLVVSCDNVGVIAMATRDLPEARAVTARRLGIGLSIVFKLVFVALIGMLFDVPWLHIRIIGGFMLLYVTWNMLRKEAKAREAHPGQLSADPPEHAGGRREGSFLFALVSIIAADISMSLDNVIAILSIVAEEGEAPGAGEMLLVLGGLLACVPLLLWFSGAVAKLMDRFRALNYLCTGYLVYLAVSMIFEDATVVLFFQQAHFTFAQPAAVLCGGLAAVACLFTGRASTPQSARRRKVFNRIAFFVALYSIALVGFLTYLGSNPVIRGFTFSAEILTRHLPSGVAAVYTLSTSSSIFAICSCVLAGSMAEYGPTPRGYRRMLLSTTGGTTLFLLLELAVCTLGLGLAYGPGSLSPGDYLFQLLLQLLLHTTYGAVFCMLRAFIRNQAVCIAVGMLYIHVESMLAEICMYHASWRFAAGFFPSFYIFALPFQQAGLSLALQAILISGLYFVTASWLGLSRQYWSNHRKNRPVPSVTLK